MRHQQPAQVRRPEHQPDSSQNQQNQQGKFKNFNCAVHLISPLRLKSSLVLEFHKFSRAATNRTLNYNINILHLFLV